MTSDGDFPKEEHILKSKDFRIAYRKGVSSRKGAIILYSSQNSLTHNRIGFSISSSNVKRATRRNRIRRLFRETYRLRKDSLKKGYDIVIVVKRDLDKTLSREKIEDIFLKLAKETGLAL